MKSDVDDMSVLVSQVVSELSSESSTQHRGDDVGRLIGGQLVQMNTMEKTDKLADMTAMSLALVRHYPT
jgi:hypothetical protein